MKKIKMYEMGKNVHFKQLVNLIKHSASDHDKTRTILWEFLWESLTVTVIFLDLKKSP